MSKRSLKGPAVQSKGSDAKLQLVERDDVQRAGASLSSVPTGDEEQEASEGDLVLLVSADGIVKTILDCPDYAGELHPGEMTGLSVDAIWPGEISGAVKDNIRRVLRGRNSRSIRLEDNDRSKSWEFLLVAQGRERALIIVRDISAAHEQIRSLERLAYIDDPTGLPNRAWFFAELERAVERSRLIGARTAVICFEIDQLDVAAQSASEADRNSILKRLAGRIQNGLRGANNKDEQDDERYSAIARVDFERFAIILPVVETGDDAAAVAGRMIQLLEHPLETDASQGQVKVAAGIALYPQDGKEPEELYDNAVTAMQDAKNSLSTQQKFHSGTVRMRSLERQDLELELKAALNNGGFLLHYLPIVERESRRVAAAEALLRWPKPVFGANSIREVVAVADYTGMMVPIGEWVFSHACRQLAEWQQNGHSDLCLAVNVSAQEFACADLVDRTERVLRDTGIEAHCLAIEITEHLLFRDAIKNFPVCGGLKDLGVHLSVDDFGTGMCSFDHLSRSPIDTVKIHLDFVTKALRCTTGRAACAAITAMAHELDIRVVAEGVESAEQAAILDEIGCDYLQGFLFCMPSAADEFTKYLAAGTSGDE